MKSSLDEAPASALRAEGPNLLLWTGAAALSSVAAARIGLDVSLKEPVLVGLLVTLAVAWSVGWFTDRLRREAAAAAWRAVGSGSRHLSSQIAAYLPDGREEPEEFVAQQAAWVHVLRCQLREEDPAEDKEVRRVVWPEQLRRLRDAADPAQWLLHDQLEAAAHLARDGVIGERHLQSIDGTVRGLLDAQLVCLEFAGTPPPPVRPLPVRALLLVAAVLLPLPGFQPLSIALAVGVCLITGRLVDAGMRAAAPFAHGGGLPLTRDSLSIERDTLARVGSRDVPELRDTGT